MPTPDENRESDDFIDELFFEQTTSLISQAYSGSLLKSLLSLFYKFLYFTRLKICRSSISPDVYISFFNNEKNAINEYLKIRNISALHLYLGDRNLIGFILDGKKIEIYQDILQFTRYICEKKIHDRRMDIPLIAFLLRRQVRYLIRKNGIKNIVTTNMQHPYSIACAQAALDEGISSTFLEHATTPRAVLHDRYYSKYIVNFPHTKKLLEQHGHNGKDIEVIHDYHIKIRKIDRVDKIIYCINDLDSTSGVQCVLELMSKLPTDTVLRVHESDGRVDYFKQLSRSLSIDFSLAGKSHISSLYSKSSLFVCGNTNVLADCIINAQPVIYLWQGPENLFDFYGIVDSYDIPKFTNAANAIKFIKSKIAI